MNVGIKMRLKITSLLIAVALLAACATQPTPVEPNDNESEQTGQEKEQPSEPIEKEAEESVGIQFPEVSLQKKDEGEDVLLLQEALQEIGYELPLDGDYSEVTTWAITDFQLQMGNLSATGIYDEATKKGLEKFAEKGKAIEAGAALPPLTEAVFTNSGSEVSGNPYDLLAIVNKENALPEDYVPNDLVVPDVRFPFTEDLPKKQLRAPAADALEQLFAAADETGFPLFAQSGYRSHERQVGLFTAYVSEHGEVEANQFSARPGESEHQTGLSMDISSETVNYQLVTDFGDTPEGKWVKDNAHQFGFIIRYPKGKEEITKYQFEPWHLRYVGEKAAKEIMENNITLEEYFNEDN